MTTEKHHILTPHQQEIAAAICAVLNGCEHVDAFAAIISVSAATINNRAANRAEALFVAEALADDLVAIVEAGQDGLLEMAP
ncbi:hypothetical protein SAMN05892877_11017 [Rhizobium subbaraonis]|uniref:Uncharacterized protein n=1 Tax=Rhizobium subbaraonis TaxID=908946 RepID=A0A285UKP7_9HYPH|nr:hypothetical protein [Rhizobium subbaraonis]SOC42475.1 hypothetical protein SAMN05892877_11017 [Rhizobium subbaraonis]